MLGLAIKANKLVTGTDLVVTNIRKGKVRLVILASDLAENGREEIESALKKHPAKVIDIFTSQEISHAIGKERKVLALTDVGFAKALLKKINEGV